MPSQALFDQILALGRGDNADEIARLPGAGDHAQVLLVSSRHLQALLDYCAALPPAEREWFVKGIALYENTIGGLGSVTNLKRLLPLLGQAQESVIDWILRNTRSYWYYAHGAKSLADYEAIECARTHRTSESLLLEKERELQAKARKAKVATATSTTQFVVETSRPCAHSW